MAGSSWEESQERNRSTGFWLWVAGIAVTAAVLAGVLYYNNRDILSGKSDSRKEEERNASQKTGREVFSAGAEKGHQAAATPASGRKVVRDSITLSGVSCGIAERGDIRLRVTATFYFADPDRASDVRGWRETMAVLVQKSVWSLPLAHIKKERISGALVDAVNTAFETKIFTEVSIDTITVEKVNSE